MSLLDSILGPDGVEGALAELWAEPAQTIVKALGAEKAVSIMGSNAAFALAPTGRAWLVLSGTLDLFLLAGEAGTRHHVMRLEAGAIAFGMASEAGGRGILAVPSNGAELTAIDVQRLDALRSRDDVNLALAHAVDLWVAPFIHAATGAAAEGTAQSIEDDDVEVGEGEGLVAANGVRWVSADVGAIRLPDGRTITAADMPWSPVVRGARLKTNKAMTIHPVATAPWLASSDWRASLDRLHATLAEALEARAAEAESLARERIASRRARAEGGFESALTALAQVVGWHGTHGPEASDDPFLAAAARVAHAAGISTRLNDTQRARVMAAKDQVDVFARALDVHVRRITLEGHWWSRDHGPLLGFLKDGRRPVALIPDKHLRYSIVDPTTGVETPIDETKAQEIEDQCYYFFEFFPAGQLGPRELFRFAVRATRRDAGLAATMVVLTGLLSLANPVVTGWIMDSVIPSADLSQLTVLTLALLIIGLSIVAFSFVQSIAMMRMEGRAGYRAQAAVWDRLLRLNTGFFRDFSVGDLANRAQGIDAIRQMVTGSVTASIVHGVTGLFSLGLMVFYEWKLTGIIVVLVAVYCAIVLVVGRIVLSRTRDMQRLTGRIQGTVFQLLGAVSKLRVAGAERAAFARWSLPYAELMAVSNHQSQLNNSLVVFKTVFQSLLSVALIAAIGLFGHQLFAFFNAPQSWEQLNAETLHAVLPVPTFIAFNTAFGQFVAAAFGLTMTAIQLVNIKPLYERVKPILEAPQESEQGALDPGEVTGRLEIRGVSFRYKPEGPLVLHDLTIEASPGQFIAVVGPSGAGKSSLVRLVLGFDPPAAGSIFIDGKDVKLLDKRALRRNFGVVLQNGQILSGSIFHNITAGANLTREDAMAAAQLAGFDKDIESMPMGLDTFLSEGAATLSGGQRQRLMIARAVVRRPRFLIFDEATSALDNETQAIVSQGIERLAATRIVIAHRLSTIIKADKIYVLEAGRLAESGRFDELMAKDGVFAQLARRQIA
jgi:ATP-binding cassette subfamily C protein